MTNSYISCSQPKEFRVAGGYGAFTVSVSQLDKTVACINSQETHRQKKTFQEEYLEFLKKHGVEHDERYLWD
jgi:hypothetical protein